MCVAQLQPHSKELNIVGGGGGEHRTSPTRLLLEGVNQVRLMLIF